MKNCIVAKKIYFHSWPSFTSNEFFVLLCQTPEPMYTEGDVKALKEQHAEEMQLLQEEYEWVKESGAHVNPTHFTSRFDEQFRS